MSAGGGWDRIFFLTPSFYPAGGIVKVFDYVNHALSLGLEAVVCSPEPYEKGLPLFGIPRFSGISPENGVRFTGLENAAVGPTDLAFFSWPPHYEILAPRLSRWTRHEQVIHIVQGTRHSNPLFVGGYALRLLTRPMSRIATNEVVLGSMKPYLNPSSLTRVITLGHDVGFFAKGRFGRLGRPTKVAYTTWKSDVGDRVASLLARDPNYRFKAIRKRAGWRDLRRLYHWADVFLATPLAEEGFYLPGLEAMAAGAVVLAPDAGGNRAYCDFGHNCLPVKLDDASSYASVLKLLERESPGDVDRLRRNGYTTAKRHTLTREREEFAAFLDRLTDRLSPAE